jgi:ferredoxin
VADETRDIVTLSIDGRAVPCPRGSTLLNAILNAGLLVETACGGQGTCHLCRATITAGDAGTPTAIETRALGNVLLASGVRLSCQVRVEGPLAVRLPVYESPAQRKARIRRARERKK